MSAHTRAGKQKTASPFPALLVLSAMIRGAADGTQFQVWDYKEEEVEALLDQYFEADPPGRAAASPHPTT